LVFVGEAVEGGHEDILWLAETGEQFDVLEGVLLLLLLLLLGLISCAVAETIVRRGIHASADVFPLMQLV
jgi:hypothetical protein